jgi:solute carrier family 25 (peroxisomal adenine nucleotide transporter), member 17
MSKSELTLYEIIKKEVLSYNALTHAISGTVGGFTAMSTFYPLDNIRTYLQVVDKKDKTTWAAIRDYFEEGGVSALYAGLSPVLFSLACSNFVYFYSYNLLKAVVKKSTGEVSVGSNLLIAAVAGCINVL